jgi:hypothetical protein
LFIVTVVLFQLPAFFLWAAWRRSRIDAAEADTANWRKYCGTAALLAATCCTVLEILFLFSWFKNGGSPHGMMPSDGLWTFIGRVRLVVWAFAASIVLGAFGKGKMAAAISWLGIVSSIRRISHLRLGKGLILRFGPSRSTPSTPQGRCHEHSRGIAAGPACRRQARRPHAQSHPQRNREIRSA